MLQAEIPKLGKLSRSPGYGGYCIKYKQQLVVVKLLYQIQATGHGDVDIGGQWKSTWNLINGVKAEEMQNPNWWCCRQRFRSWANWVEAQVMEVTVSISWPVAVSNTSKWSLWCWYWWAMKEYSESNKWSKGRGNGNRKSTTLQAKIPKLGKLSRSPGYGGYCIKYKWFLDLLLYQIQATGCGDVDIGRRWKSTRKSNKWSG